MKHICETMRDYIEAMNNSKQGDAIFCSNELWDQIMKSQFEPPKDESEKAMDELVEQAQELNLGY